MNTAPAASRGHWLTQLVTKATHSVGVTLVEKSHWFTGRVSKLGLSPMQPSTQKFGRSSICCQSETSFPVPSIQATFRPRCRPEPRLNLEFKKIEIIRNGILKNVKPGSSEEVLGLPDPVVVPDRKLKASLHHLNIGISIIILVIIMVIMVIMVMMTVTLSMPRLMMITQK